MDIINTIDFIRELAEHFNLFNNTKARGTIQYVKVYTRNPDIDHDMAVTIAPTPDNELKICIGTPRYGTDGFDKINIYTNREELIISRTGEIKYAKCYGSSKILGKKPKWLLAYEKNGWEEAYNPKYDNMKWIRLTLALIDQWRFQCEVLSKTDHHFRSKSERN